MDVLTPVITGALLAIFTTVPALLGKSQFDALRGEINLLRSEVRGDLAELRSEMAIMRSDLTHIALAVGARPKPQTG